MIEFKDGTHFVNNVTSVLRKKDLGFVNKENTIIQHFSFDLLLEFLANNKDITIEYEGVSTTLSKHLFQFTPELLFPKDKMNKTPTKVYLKILHKGLSQNTSQIRIYSFKIFSK